MAPILWLLWLFVYEIRPLWDEYRLHNDGALATASEVSHVRTYNGRHIKETEFDLTYVTADGVSRKKHVQFNSSWYLDSMLLPLVVRYDPASPEHVSTSYGVLNLTGRTIHVVWWSSLPVIWICVFVLMILGERRERKRKAVELAAIGARPTPRRTRISWSIISAPHTPNRLRKLTDEDWLNIFQFNVMSVRMTRHHLPRMVKRGWGRVVFISSESGVNIPKEMIGYGMTKTAQLAVSRGLAESVAGTGVTVNAVLPGPTRSESLIGWMKGIAESQGITMEEAEAQFLKTMRPTSLINRFATTDEVANMVIYVCSEQASATSGAALRVDGGVVRYVA